MKEIEIMLDGRKIVVQYDDKAWNVKDNPLNESWPGAWSFRKVRYAIKRYDLISKEKNMDDQISFQKQVIRDEYINKEINEFGKKEEKRIHLGPKQIRKTMRLNNQSSIDSMPSFKSKN